MQEPREHSDAAIREDVHQRIAQDIHVDASNVGIDVADGVVTLTGTVPEPGQDAVVERHAWAAVGVRQVDNRVTLPAPRTFEGEMLPANTFQEGQVRPGMRVVGNDGIAIGTVKEVRAADFLVNRPLARDVYVPFESVLTTSSPGESSRGGPTQRSEVVLTLRSEQMDDAHWRSPHGGRG